MKILITLLVLFVSAHSFANSIKLQPKELMLSGEDIKKFRLIDINNDGKSDIVWKTTDGDLKYRLRDATKLSEDISYEEKFHPTETMISGENIKTFKLTDINEDGKLDVVYRNAENHLSYQLQSKGDSASENLHTYGFKQTDAEIESMLSNSKWMVFHASETIDFVGKKKPYDGARHGYWDFNHRSWGIGSKHAGMLNQRSSSITVLKGKLYITHNRNRYYVNMITDNMMQGTISSSKTSHTIYYVKPSIRKHWIAFRISE